MNRRVAAAVLAALAAASVGGCAKKGPPSGGPPDITPPRLVAAVPDSAAAGVARDVRPELTFSEGMEPRSTGDAVAFAPAVPIAQRRWKGNTLTLVLAESLAANRTYTVFVGTSARDRHGNVMVGGAARTFTTADRFPEGRLEGHIETRGLAAGGTYMWVYEYPREPDSTARDYDALSLTDLQGHFDLVGLAVPARYRLWAFADLNRNRSFEPQTDVLAPVDTVFDLTAEHPQATGLAVLVVNPHAEASVRGAVLDSLGDSLGVVRMLSISEADTTVRLLGEVFSQNVFELHLAPGAWRILAFRDLDKNRRWDPAKEPASEVLRVELFPAAALENQELVLQRPRGEPVPR